MWCWAKNLNVTPKPLVLLQKKLLWSKASSHKPHRQWPENPWDLKFPRIINLLTGDSSTVLRLRCQAQIHNLKRLKQPLGKIPKRTRSPTPPRSPTPQRSPRTPGSEFSMVKNHISNTVPSAILKMTKLQIKLKRKLQSKLQRKLQRKLQTLLLQLLLSCATRHSQLQVPLKNTMRERTSKIKGGRCAQLARKWCRKTIGVNTWNQQFTSPKFLHRLHKSQKTDCLWLNANIQCFFLLWFILCQNTQFRANSSLVSWSAVWPSTLQAPVYFLCPELIPNPPHLQWYPLTGYLLETCLHVVYLACRLTTSPWSQLWNAPAQ